MFKHLSILLAVTLLLVSYMVCSVTADENAEDDFVSLFDGKSIESWHGNKDIFRVENGTIIGGSLKEKIPHNEFLSTSRKYGDFELGLQAKLIGEGRNAGVQFRTKRIPDHYEVIGYQCDMGLMGEKNIWGSLYDESRRRKFLAEAKQAPLLKKFNANGWNDLRIVCQGPRIQIWVNGVQTVNYLEQDDQIERDGIIALQIHGGAPAEASYRHIRIKEFK